MLDRVFGGPVVQLVEYGDGKVLYKAKRSPKVGSVQNVRVAGLSGSKVKVSAKVESARSLIGGGFLALALVLDSGQRSALCPLKGINRGIDMRQHPRTARRVDINCTDLVATSVDISSGGMQVETRMSLQAGQVLALTLIPGLQTQARVAWVLDERAGLEFLGLDEATRLLVSRFAEGRVIPTVDKSKSSARLKAAAPPSYE
jgi:hypothetical protein